MNIHFEAVLSKTDATFLLRVQVRNDNGEPKATIGMLDPNDENLKEKMDLIIQAYRVGRLTAGWKN